MKPVDRIEALLNCLPEKDSSLGYKFLSKRDFSSLKELIDSAIYKKKKKLRNSEILEEGNCIDEDLYKLKAEVDTYIIQLGITESLYDDLNDYEIKEDLY